MERIASLVTLSPSAIRKLKITDAYSVHRVIYSLFPEKEQRVLYCDLGGSPEGRKILLLSESRPTSEGGLVKLASQTVPDAFTDRAQYAFKVVINPVRCDAKSRKRVPIKDPLEIRQWFVERAASWGFRVDDQSVEILKTGVVQFAGKSGNRVTLSQAHVKGVLTVTDRNLFKQSFAMGIGKGKAFGCGLLQITAL